MSTEKKEVNEKSKGSRFRVTLLVVLLFGVFLGFGFAVGIEKDINIHGNNIVVKNTVDKKETKDNAVYTELATDSMIVNLFERTKAVSIGVDGTRYANKKLLVSEMSDEYKGLIAANYFMKFNNFIPLGGPDYKYTINEKAVQYGYDSIFGAGTYKPGQAIYTGCGNYTYDYDNREYVTNQGGCGGTSAQTAFEYVIRAQRNSNNLKITTGVIFATQEGYFKSYDDMDDVSKAINYTSGPNNEAEYILSNKNNLQQITYTFEVDNNGFYKYVGFERTQEAK